MITLDEALTAYEPTLRKRGARVYNAQAPRHHLSDTLLAKPVSLLTEDELEGWRGEHADEGPRAIEREPHHELRCARR